MWFPSSKTTNLQRDKLKPPEVDVSKIVAANRFGFLEHKYDHRRLLTSLRHMQSGIGTSAKATISELLVNCKLKTIRVQTGVRQDSVLQPSRLRNIGLSHCSVDSLIMEKHFEKLPLRNQQSVLLRGHPSSKRHRNEFDLEASIHAHSESRIWHGLSWITGVLKWSWSAERSITHHSGTKLRLQSITI